MHGAIPGSVIKLCQTQVRATVFDNHISTSRSRAGARLHIWKLIPQGIFSESVNIYSSVYIYHLTAETRMFLTTRG